MSEMPPTNPVDPTPGGPSVPVTPVSTTTPVLVADPADVEKNKIMAVLAYIGILVLIPIFVAKNSPFARYHANQGLILLIVSFVVMFVLGIATLIVSLIRVLQMCACLMMPLMGLVWLAILALSIYGIINAATGKMKPLPVIGKFTILK